MNKYQNGKIYMIESLEGNCKYYGSTIQPLHKRLYKHRETIKKEQYITSSEVLKYPDAKILLVELYPCTSKMELLAKEAEYIRNNDCVNKRSKCATKEESNKLYREKNKEKIKLINKLYREKNNDKIKDHKNKKCMCECGTEYTHNHLQRHLRTKQHINNIKNNI